jgi:catechol 2,3-dioxygenase-like lactoylglutathione lyase family enzyme
VIDHLAIQCRNIEASAAFYDEVLVPLGGWRLMESHGALGYGVDFPCFWLGAHHTGEGFRESHLAFRAPDRAAVDAFCEIALRLGAEILHEPRIWPEYHPGYYGGFVRDPDGNNVEAVHHTFTRPSSVDRAVTPARHA